MTRDPSDQLAPPSLPRRVGRWWNRLSLVVRIAVGLAIGTVLGLTLPAGAPVELAGELFVAALKAVAPVLVFVLVIAALAGARAETKMRTILLLYLVGTLTAAFIAAGFALAFPARLTLGEAQTQEAVSGIGQVMRTLALNVVSNPVQALASANYLGILAWAVLIGVAMRLASQTTKTVLSNLAEAVAQVVRWIIALAPLGVLGLVYASVSSAGLGIFRTYGHLLVLLVGAMLVIALGTNPLMVWLLLRKNPYRLVWRCLKDSGLTAFFTRSSAANIPVNLELCRRLGLDRDTYSVSIPLGATINMAGAAVTITVMSLSAAHTLGVSIDLPTAVVLCALAAASACGASGVAGGSLLLIPLACSLFGISNDVAMQVVGIGLIIGVIQDSCETALNSSSDVLFTATAEYRTWKRAGRSFRAGALVEA